MSNYGIIFGPYLPVFSPNTGKYDPEKKNPYLGTFHAMQMRKCPNKFLICLDYLYKKYCRAVE